MRGERGGGGGATIFLSSTWAHTSSARRYFNTYGGNSVACAIGEAVLDAIEEDGLQENAKTVGQYLKHRMTSLRDKHGEWIGDVRGEGLFQG